jgi:hypothetical protein
VFHVEFELYVLLHIIQKYELLLFAALFPSLIVAIKLKKKKKKFFNKL